jgi:hypothetical protein
MNLLEQPSCVLIRVHERFSAEAQRLFPPPRNGAVLEWCSIYRSGTAVHLKQKIQNPLTGGLFPFYDLSLGIHLHQHLLHCTTLINHGKFPGLLRSQVGTL